MKNLTRRILSLLTLLALFSLLTACSSPVMQPLSSEPEPQVSSQPAESEPEPTPEPPPEPVPPSEPVSEPEPEPVINDYIPEEGHMNPLTGLESDSDKLGRRPIAVMINNIKASLPQKGITSADIVYEVLAEGNITRLLAIIQDPSAIEALGSVRSARLYYIQLALGHDAIFFHAGGSDEAYNYIADLRLTTFDGVRGPNNGLYYRDQQRLKTTAYEHTLFTDGERIENILAAKANSLRMDIANGKEEAFRFASAEYTPEGSDADELVIEYSSLVHAGFVLDPDSGLYAKSQFNGPHLDELTGEAIAFKNLFILETDITVIDTKGRRKVVNVGSGDGLYVTNGSCIPVKWERGGVSDLFEYYTADGSPLEVNRGKSYVGIVSDLDSVVFPEA